MDEGKVQEGGCWRNVGAQLVLAVCKVDSVLGADTGIDVGEQGGWDSNIRRASSIERGSQAHNVQTHTSTNGNDRLHAAV